MTESGFIKIYRSLLSWEWYDDIITKTVFLHLLLTVNIKDSRFRGVEVPKGSRVYSYNSLCEELGITMRQARTAISHMRTTGEVTTQNYPQFSIISIQNWDKFQTVRQGSDKASDKVATSTVTSERQHNKNIKKKELSKDIPKSISLESREKPKSQYREVGADEW